MPWKGVFMEVLMENLTREEFAKLLEKVEAVIIPVGSHEQHGPHLPFKHDIASALFIAKEVARRLYPRVLVAPPVAVGLSPHHMRWPGTLTLKTETFVKVLVDLCESLSKHGVKRVVILNGHAGNYHTGFVEGAEGAPIDLAIMKARSFGLKVTGASYWDLIPPSIFHDILRIDRDAGHAGEFETSVGLYIYPELVRFDRAGRAEGISGGADMASSEKGRMIVEEAINGAVAFVEDFIQGKIEDVHYHRPFPPP
ncbi:MAG: creatininase family protein [Candidatus Bathyarchaeia archaeon]